MDVEAVVRALLGSARVQGGEEPASLLAVAVPYPVGWAAGRQALERLDRAGVRLAVYAVAGAPVEGVGRPVAALPVTPAEAAHLKGLVYPVLPPGLAHGLVAVDERDPAVAAGWAAIVAGRPVAALVAALDPAHAEWRRLPGALARQPLEAPLGRLRWEVRRIGVRLLTRPEEFVELFGRSDGPAVVDEAQVIAAHARGERRLVLAPRTVVTPLARDRARALGIEIVRNEGGTRRESGR